MKLTLRFNRPNFADSTFSIEAKGFLLAALYWADADGPLANWTALGFVPLGADGRGRFHLAGGRAVPPEATHVVAELIGLDPAQRERLLTPIPEAQRVPPGRFARSFVAMSDLHLSNKPGRIRRALRMAQGADCLLLAGDLVNDGLPEQFALFRQLLEEELPDVPALAVCGNHDWPLCPLPRIPEGADDYPAFQRWLLERAAALGVDCAEANCGAWEARFDGLRLLGLNAATHWRRFMFPGGEQLDWLEARLRDAGRSVVLCHAPLLAHNPVRGPGDAPYLSRDARLQGILDAARNVILLSGHTHISLNEPAGCVEADEARGNVYINDSSVAPTTLRQAEAPSAREWLDGAMLRLNVEEGDTELRARALSSGKEIARGYYRWKATDV